MNGIYWRKLGIYVFGVLVLAVDSAYFDLFTLLIPYLAVEYLIFSSIVSIVRVMVILTIHSALCFQSQNFFHLMIFATYVFFITTREYFLKPFIPFLLYNIAVTVLLFFEGSSLIMTIILSILSMSIWRINLEKA